MDSETWQEDEHIKSTVGNREMGTGISEASKRVPIFLHDVRGGRQASFYFRQRNWVPRQFEANDYGRRFASQD